PARRKFLRKNETEFGHIADIVTRLALASPKVSFRLLHNGRSLIEVYGQTGLEDRISALLGRPLLKDLLPVAVESDDSLQLQGYLSRPDLHRATTGAIYTFINGRYMRDRVVQHALLDGYRNVLVKGRYPVVVLFLTLDPAWVDVNVHPTKHEVRFRDQRRVHDFISNAVRELLRPSAWLRESADRDAPPAAEPQMVLNEVAPAADDYRDRVRESLQRYTASGATRAAQSFASPPPV
ncbi:MAG: DNA mismatch repair endonuclease MutL, partial [Desulfuromonadaceae bacterium]